MSRKDDVINDLQKLAATQQAAGHHQKTKMPDDPNKTGSDRKLISLEQEHEVCDWARSLGCTEDGLREAVKAVGHSAEAVRRYLNRGKDGRDDP